MLVYKGGREDSQEWREWQRQVRTEGRILFEDAQRILTIDDEVEKQRIEGIRTRVNILNGRTPLIVACRAGDCEQVRLLLRSGADPTVPDRSGMTPLHEAAHMGQPEAVMLLLQFDVDVEILDTRWNITPIHQAAFSGNPQVVQVLHDHGAQINRRTLSGPNVPDGDTALLRAQRNLQRMQGLQLDPNYSPAFEAAHARYLLDAFGMFSPTVESCAAVVRLLIKLGAVE